MEKNEQSFLVENAADLETIADEEGQIYPYKVHNYDEIPIVIESHRKQAQTNSSSKAGNVVQVNPFPTTTGTTKRLCTVSLIVRGDGYEHKQGDFFL